MKKRCLDCKWFGVVYNEDEIEPCDITVCMGEEPEWRTLKVTDQYGIPSYSKAIAAPIG
jgi:hypothetical protein